MNTKQKIITLLLLLCPFANEAVAMRIVSLVPSLTQNIVYLDAEAFLVGKTSYCKTSQSIPVVATAIDVNVEKVLALKPDLVLTSSLTKPETIAALKRMGVKVESYPSPHSYAELCSQFLQLGKRIGKPHRAKKVLAEANARVNKVRNRPQKSRKIFFQLGANPIFSVIDGTFMSDYIAFAGAKNAFTGLKSGVVAREAVLAKNPDVIFIATMGGIGEQEQKNWQKYARLSAVRSKKIFLIDSERACLPTPVTFAETLEIIANCLK